MANPIRKILKHSIENSTERLPRGAFEGSRRTKFGSKFRTQGRTISNMVDLEYVSNSMLLGDTEASTSITIHRNSAQDEIIYIDFNSQGARGLNPDVKFNRGQFSGSTDKMSIKNLARVALNLNRASAIAQRIQ